MVSIDFEEIMTSELLSLTGGVVAGLVLAYAADALYLVPALFILFPGFMEMRGNISGSLSARITSGMFVGVMKYRHEKRKILLGNILAATAQVVIVSIFLGVVAYFASSWFFGVTDANIILIALLAGILSNVIEIPITILTTLSLFRAGIDPNNIMGPYITTIGDIISVSSLLIAIAVVAL